MCAWHRKFVSVGASVAALSLGGWIAAQLWPHWRASPAEAAVRAAEPPVIMPPPPGSPDARVASLGTDASLSGSALRLVLVSTAPGRELADSTATLGPDARNPQTYAGGALLSNGARLSEIHADHVVLSLGSERTRLTLHEPVTVGAATTDPPPAFISSREDLSEFLRPQPVFDGDSVSGLAVYPGLNVSRLARLGLEAGDIIRSVEGRPVQSPDDWQLIDDALSSRSSIAVSIERKGSLVHVSMDGARLAGDESAR